MAEGLVLGVLAAVVQEVVMRLIKRVKNVEGTDAESRELQEFLSYLKKNSSLCVSSSKGAKTILQRSLDEAKTELEKWESKNSGFIARSSDDRVKELHAIRRRVKNAITTATFKIVDDGHLKLNLVDRHVIDGNRKLEDKIDLIMKHLGAQELPREHPSMSDNDGGKTKPAPSKPPKLGATIGGTGSTSNNDGGKTKLAPSKPPKLGATIGGTGSTSNNDGGKTKPAPSKPPKLGATIGGTGSTSNNDGGKTKPAPSKPPKLGATIGGTSSTSNNDGGKTKPAPSKPPKLGATVGGTGKLKKSNSKKRSVRLWQHLRAPMDSEKQARDIKESLLCIEGVKEVHYDQPNHKVSVLLHEGSNVKLDALLEAAQLKDKVKPTAWK